MKKRSKTLRIGSVSTGTTNPIHLLREFLDTANTIALQREERFTVQRIRQRFNGADPYPQLTEDLDAMVLILEDHCPDYTTFSNTPQDGADWGVHVDWEGVEYEIYIDGMGKGDTLPSKMVNHQGLEFSHFLLVNDHGNATLYRRAARRWVKIWAVV